MDILDPSEVRSEEREDPQYITQPKGPSFMKEVVGKTAVETADAVAALGTGMALWPPSKIAGMATILQGKLTGGFSPELQAALAGGDPKAIARAYSPIDLIKAPLYKMFPEMKEPTSPEMIRTTAEAAEEDVASYAWQPRTKGAERVVEGVGKGLEVVLGPAKWLGEKVTEAGYPNLGYITQFGGELATFKGLHIGGKKVSTWLNTSNAKIRRLAKKDALDTAEGQRVLKEVSKEFEEAAEVDPRVEKLKNEAISLVRAEREAFEYRKAKEIEATPEELLEAELRGEVPKDAKEIPSDKEVAVEEDVTARGDEVSRKDIQQAKEEGRPEAAQEAEIVDIRKKTIEDTGRARLKSYEVEEVIQPNASMEFEAGFDFTADNIRSHMKIWDEAYYRLPQDTRNRIALETVESGKKVTLEELRKLHKPLKVVEGRAEVKEEALEPEIVKETQREIYYRNVAVPAVRDSIEAGSVGEARAIYNQTRLANSELWGDKIKLEIDELEARTGVSGVNVEDAWADLKEALDLEAKSPGSIMDNDIYIIAGKIGDGRIIKALKLDTPEGRMRRLNRLVREHERGFDAEVKPGLEYPLEEKPAVIPDEVAGEVLDMHLESYKEAGKAMVEAVKEPTDKIALVETPEQAGKLLRDIVEEKFEMSEEGKPTVKGDVENLELLREDIAEVINKIDPQGFGDSPAAKAGMEMLEEIQKVKAERVTKPEQTLDEILKESSDLFDEIYEKPVDFKKVVDKAKADKAQGLIGDAQAALDVLFGDKKVPKVGEILKGERGAILLRDRRLLKGQKFLAGNRIESTYRTADGRFTGTVKRVIFNKTSPDPNTRFRYEIEWDHGITQTLGQNRIQSRGVLTNERGVINIEFLSKEDKARLKVLANMSKKSGKTVYEHLREVGYEKKVAKDLDTVSRAIAPENLGYVTPKMSDLRGGRNISTEKALKTRKGVIAPFHVSEHLLPLMKGVKEIPRSFWLGKMAHEWSPKQAYRVLEQHGLGWLKEEYHAVEDARFKEQVSQEKMFKGLWKGVNIKSQKRIGAYRLSQRPEGPILLEAGGIHRSKIPSWKELTPKEQQISKYLDDWHGSILTRTNDMRVSIGKKPITAVKNYETFAELVSWSQRIGNLFDMSKVSAAELNSMIKQFSEAPVSYIKRTTGKKYRPQTNAKVLADRYLYQAMKHIHLSPVVALSRAITRKLKNYEKLTKAGEPSMWKLRWRKPNLSRYLEEWGNFVAVGRAEGLGFIPKALDQLRHNIIVATLSQVRSGFVQPAALRGAVSSTNWYRVAQGIIDLTRPAKRAFAFKNSNKLSQRKYAAHQEDFMHQVGMANKLGAAYRGWNKMTMAWMKMTDMATAIASWNAAYRHAGTKAGGSLTSKIVRSRYADSVLERTQGVTLPGDLAPIQRHLAGRTLTMFQSFNINDWFYFWNDIIGAGKYSEKLSKSKRFTRGLNWLLAGWAINVLFEDVMDTNSPLPTPVRAVIEAQEEDLSFWKSVSKVGMELIEPFPIIGGAARYGSSVVGAAVQWIQDLFAYAGDDPYKTSPLGLAGKGVGLGGTAQLEKIIRGRKKDPEDLWGQAIGRKRKPTKTLQRGAGGLGGTLGRSLGGPL